MEELFVHIRKILWRNITDVERESVVRISDANNFDLLQAKSFFTEYLNRKNNPCLNLETGMLVFHKYTLMDKARVTLVKFRTVRALEKIKPIMKKACDWQDGACIKMRMDKTHEFCCNRNISCPELTPTGCGLKASEWPILCHFFLCQEAWDEFEKICEESGDLESIKLYRKARKVFIRHRKCIDKEWMKIRYNFSKEDIPQGPLNKLN